jgi:integrase
MATIRKRKWRKGNETLEAWQVNFVDARGNRGRRQFPSRREAEAFRIETENKIRTGTYRSDASKVTVLDAAELFLEHCKARMKRRERMTQHMYNVYEGYIRNYICPDPERHRGKTRNKRLVPFKDGLTNVKLAQLTARVVSDFRDSLRDAGVSVPTTRRIINSLKVMLSYAVTRDLIGVNVARGIKVIGRRDEGSKKIVPPSKEAMRLLLKAADLDFSVKLAFASSTGVRAGELHALRWRHLDFERGEVKIETRVDAYKNEDVTKTAAGMRTIPLSAKLILRLKEWKLRTKRSKNDDLVFPNRRGWYVNHDNMVKQKFLKLFEKLETQHAKEPNKHPLPPVRFNWHALRHFAISTWIEAGLAPKTVQTFAGHSSLAVTMDRYGHLFKSDDHRKAMEKIAAELLG